jgi:hypothetical protein
LCTLKTIFAFHSYQRFRATLIRFKVFTKR